MTLTAEQRAMLGALKLGPQRAGDLREVAKIWRVSHVFVVIDSLLAAGLIRHGVGFYEITDAGLAALIGGAT
jgi:hypothetical protein